MTDYINRRELVAGMSALAAFRPRLSLAQQRMPMRPIPVSGEMLPVIGLGGGSAIRGSASDGAERLREVLRTFVSHGGSVVETLPRDPEDDRAYGRVINEPEFRDELFIATKITTRDGRQAGIEQFRGIRERYSKETIDLMQVFQMIDIDTHWASLRDWKASGQARYIGVTVSDQELYSQLESFLRRETPDFVQVNYSISERLAEERVIPLAADRGAAIMINGPFMNGEYFRRLEGVALPEWTAEFDCSSLAEFSLKYILANPLVTCILAESGNPVHVAENAQAALGRLPDEAAKQRMRAYIAQV